MYITHVRNNTRNQRRSVRAQVSDAVVSAGIDWINASLMSDEPIEVPSGGAIRGKAIQDRGGLVVTLFSVDDKPVLELRIALRSRHGALWPSYGAGIEARRKPAEPWCFTFVQSSEMKLSDELLTTLEDAFAWAWAERVQAMPRARV